MTDANYREIAPFKIINQRKYLFGLGDTEGWNKPIHKSAHVLHASRFDLLENRECFVTATASGFRRTRVTALSSGN